MRTKGAFLPRNAPSAHIAQARCPLMLLGSAAEHRHQRGRGTRRDRMQVQAGLPPGDRPRRPRYEELALIFITARFRVLPDRADDWPEISRAFTEATRAEEGCLWFDWSRSLDDPAEYV